LIPVLVKVIAMKLISALGMLLCMYGTSLADINATRLRNENGKIIVAQSYCGMCANTNTSCRLACNGAGTCIQACDDQNRECARQNCRR
jgi:hypothetical protein